MKSAVQMQVNMTCTFLNMLCTGTQCKTLSFSKLETRRLKNLVKRAEIEVRNWVRYVLQIALSPSVKLYILQQFGKIWWKNIQFCLCEEMTWISIGLYVRACRDKVCRLPPVCLLALVTFLTIQSVQKIALPNTLIANGWGRRSRITWRFEPSRSADSILKKFFSMKRSSDQSLYK